MDIQGYENYIRDLKYTIEKQQRKIQELNEILQKEQDTKRHYEFRIETELEPRIRQEEAAYDNWVLTDTGVEASECFEDMVDELIDMVKDNPVYFEWDSCEGDIYQMILCLIRFHILDNLKNFCITDKN